MLLGLFTQPLYAKTIVVSKSGGTSTLTKAFELAEDGDTIIVKEGVYKEGPLVLEKKVTLIGEGFPVIDGEDQHEILLLEFDDIYISGFVFKNSGTSNFNDIAALKIQNSKNFVVEGNRFENNFFAIHTMNSSHGLIQDNHVASGQVKGKSAANGIHCWKGKDITIIGNTVTGHRDGIYLEFVTDSKIEDNKSIKNSRYGLHFMFAHDNVYTNNIMSANGAGVAVMYSKRIAMYRNTFSDNWGNSAYGVLLKEIKDSHIEGNKFLDNTMGVYAEGSDRVVMKNNEYIRNGWALNIQSSCSDFEVNNNNFIGNTFDVGTNGDLRLNNFDSNYWDKYEGYDLNRDGVGDIPYRPVTFYSVIIERNPGALMLFRSFFVKLMDKAEDAFPSLTPENLRDNKPLMRRVKL